jgi:hypothetical protein
VSDILEKYWHKSKKAGCDKKTAVTLGWQRLPLEREKIGYFLLRRTSTPATKALPIKASVVGSGTAATE